MPKKLTTEEFISRIKEKDINNILSVDSPYVNSRTKVEVTCSKHNHTFLQSPKTLLSGANGCKYCYKENMAITSSQSKEYYIDKIEKLNLPYNILDVNGGDNITMFCEKHGIFPTSFTLLKRSKKHSCPKCIKENSTQGGKKDTESFKICAINIHGEGFNYDNVEYIDHKTEVNIGCNKCGNNFFQKPSIHLSGKGCTTCWTIKNREAKIYNRISIENISEKCKTIYGNTLDFSETECVTSSEKFKVFCKKCNNYFEQYKGHITRGVGCQRCSKEEKESKSEKLITKLLLEKEIVFTKEHTFNDCKYKNKLRFDFYIPSTNTCIEYQGEQHYKPVSIFGGEKALELQIKKDIIKREYCKINNIRLVEIAYSDSIEEIIGNIL